MGPSETATATTGGLEKLTFSTGTGRHRAQIIYFFRMQIGFGARSGIGLGSGSRRHRMRRCLVLSRELWIQNFGKSWSRALERKGPCLYVCTDGSARARGVGVCTRPAPTLGDPRETSGSRIDRIPPARPSWPVLRIEKHFFWPPVRVPLISLDQ